MAIKSNCIVIFFFSQKRFFDAANIWNTTRQERIHKWIFTNAGLKVVVAKMQAPFIRSRVKYIRHPQERYRAGRKNWKLVVEQRQIETTHGNVTLHFASVEHMLAKLFQPRLLYPFTFRIIYKHIDKLNVFSMCVDIRHTWW